MTLLARIEQIVDGYFALTPRSKPIIERLKNVNLVAHRGAHDNLNIIENTHEAFRLAKKAGCWGIEFDVHETADQILVVNHDPNLKRLWQHDVAISSLTFASLRALVPAIPSLAEVVSEYGQHMHLFIELKVSLHNEQHLMDVLAPLRPIKHYHLLSLKPSYFSSLTACVKQSLLLVAIHNNVRALCDLSIKKLYGGVLGNYLLLTNKHIKLLKKNHQFIGVGFVNSKNSLYREINRGVDWIFTNQAVKVSHYLHCLRQKEI